MVKPSEREFEALVAQGYNLIPVWREIAADLETPVSAFLKVARGDYAFLLESVQGGEKWGRYTFLGSEPAMVLRGRGGRLDLTRPGRSVEVRSVKSPLEGLRDEMRRFNAYQSPELPRFFGGAVGFLAYDIVRYFERLPTHAHDELGTPDLYLMLTDTVLIFDNVRQTLKIVANVALEDHPSTRAAYRAAAAKIDELIARLDAPVTRAAAGERRQSQWRRGQPGLQPDPRGLHGDGRGGQGVHRGRRRDPGGALAALRGAAGEPSVQPLPQPAHDQSVALHVLPAAGRSHAGRRVAGSDGAGGGARDHAAADRGHPPARRDRGRGSRARTRAAGRSQGARRARDAGRPGAQRRRAGRGDRLGRSDRTDDGRALLARDAHRLERARASCARDATPTTRFAPPSRRAPCRARRKSARWR